MSATGEDEHLIFLHNFSSGDYFFVCADGNNNVVGLIQITPDSVDTPEAYMIDFDVVDTMGYDILEAMELENGNICYDSYSSCGEGGIKWIITLTLCLIPFNKIIELIYIYGYLNQSMAQKIM